MNAIFIVTAINRTDDTSSTFLVEAPSHRAAWQIARAVARTGKGALYRSPQDQELHEFPIQAGTMTVTRVLSTQKNRRGRPAKILIDDLLHMADDRGVKIPPRIQKVLEELHA